MKPFSKPARTLAGIISIIGATSIVVQPTLNEGSYWENLGGMVRYFTIWGNIAATLIMGLVAMGWQVPRAILASLATSLAVVGMVYWALLAEYHSPTGLGWYTNHIHHTFVPVAVIAWWYRFTDPAPAIGPMLPAIMAPALSYGLFALILGELTGFYAYFFINQPELGWPMFLLNNAGLALFFALLGAAMVGLKKLGGRRSDPARLA